jgi:hypothetical protein
MMHVKDSPFYKDVIKEFNYSHGDVYIFEGFVVSENNYGITYSWDNHGKKVVDDIVDFFGKTGNNLVYISNRINSYAVKPNDWLKFFSHSYSIRGYGIVSKTKGGVMNTMIENLFFNKKIQRFESLEVAIDWARNKGITEAAE